MLAPKDLAERISARALRGIETLTREGRVMRMPDFRMDVGLYSPKANEYVAILCENGYLERVSRATYAITSKGIKELPSLIERAREIWKTKRP